MQHPKSTAYSAESHLYTLRCKVALTEKQPDAARSTNIYPTSVSRRSHTGIARGPTQGPQKRDHTQ